MDPKILWGKRVGEVSVLTLTKNGVLVDKCPRIHWSSSY